MPKNLSKLVLGAAVAGGIVVWFVWSGDRVDPVAVPDSESTEIYTPQERKISERTNTWFSSLYRVFPSAPLFVFPGAYQFTERGLSISDSQSVPTTNTIFGSFQTVCTVSGTEAIKGVTVERYGDWDVLVRAESLKGSFWKVGLVQGSPIVDISDFVSDLKLACGDGVQPSRYRQDALLVKRGQQPVFFVQARNAIENDGLILRSELDRYRIIQIPNVTDRPLEFFLDLPWNTVLDTQYVWYEKPGAEHIHLVTLTEGNRPIPTTIWPHHRLAGVSTASLGGYSTVYGRLDLALTDQIEFSQPQPELPTGFKPIVDPVQRAEVVESLRADSIRYQAEVPPSGVYFRGAWFGGLASLILLADAYHLEDERAKLLDLLETYFRPALGDFVYDDGKKMLIAAKNAEFGNEKGNDHHFHYGYYLRAGAVLVQYRPELRSEVEPILNEMALDIANTDRLSDRYPFLRHFSPYAGHSWADGNALFQDGNNQESSSEALNAWYALSLWGSVTSQEVYATTGRNLYAHELLGIRAYWFGEGNAFPSEYRHPIVSLVWGGKRDYATWFSADPMHVQGIQWLPITPASGYLGALPNQSERMNDLGLTSAEAADHEWGDLYTAYLSYFNPVEAANQLETASKRQVIKSKALLYHTVLKNLENRQ